MATNETTKNNGSWAERIILWKAIAIVTSILITFSTGLNTYIVNKVIDLDRRVSIIEANRFTSTDAYNLVQIINDKLDTKLSILRTEIPPTWFLNRVDKLEDRILSLERVNGIKSDGGT